MIHPGKRMIEERQRAKGLTGRRSPMRDDFSLFPQPGSDTMLRKWNLVIFIEMKQ